MIKPENSKLIFRFFPFVFLLFLVFAIQEGLHAQTEKSGIVGIFGIVMSADSMGPVPNAQILSQDNYLGTFSDDSGRFFITVNLNDSIMISSLGYNTRIIPVTDSILQLKQPIKFYMTLDTVLMHEIVIHGYWNYRTFKQMLINMKPAKSSFNVSEALKRQPLLYLKPNIGFAIFHPIQALYDLFNKRAVLQRRLIRDRKIYNRNMIKLGRPQDTIPTKPDYLRNKNP